MTTATTGAGRSDHAPEINRGLQIRLPETQAELDQHEEWCEVKLDGEWRRIRFHDYDEIFDIPGLYEQLFHDRLKCESPERVVGLLGEVLADADEKPRLRVFDLGAGNGLVGTELQRIGAETIVGLDIIPEARDAALRDRPDVYDRYLVDDMCTPSEETRKALADLRPNCLSTVAALGFNDIPPRAFVNGYNAVEPDGWIAFNVRDAFLTGDDDSGFAKLIEAMQQDGLLDVIAYRKYVHRLNVAGEELMYVAMIAQKRGDVPERLLESLER